MESLPLTDLRKPALAGISIRGWIYGKGIRSLFESFRVSYIIAGTQESPASGPGYPPGTRAPLSGVLYD